MNRNTNAYSTVDSVEIPRSHWTRKHTHITTFNAGKLIPIYFNEDIIPGTTIKMKSSYVVRLQTPLNPTMDNLIIDTWWFRAPKWWYWVNFKSQFMENKLGAWSSTIQYNTPMIQVANTAYGPNDLANYLGIPQGITGFKYDRMGINFYCDIWNCWFRSQPLQAPIIYDTSDNNSTSDGTILTGYGLLPVNRTFDYFSSGLPEPERPLPGYTGGVKLPLGTSAPVIGNGTTIGLTNGTNNYGLGSDSNGIMKSYQTNYGSNVGTTVGSTLASGKTLGVTTDGTKSGLIADLTQATAATVNALRLSFAIQRIMERSAIYGSMYRDTLRHWGSIASSMDTMIPEYLGGNREYVNIETVLSNTETSNMPLGETGAFSVTASTNVDFTKSFTMHDMLIGLMAIRVEEHKYSQGLPRQFKRDRMLDHYFPETAHVGNMPVYNYEIYCQADTVVDSDGNPVNNGVFNYKEAWQEYIVSQNRASGEMNPVYAQSLAFWHYGDKDNSLPVFGNTWMQEPIYNIDRTLAVTSSEANQFFGDFYFEEEVSAPIPLNRIPGLIDHY